MSTVLEQLTSEQISNIILLYREIYGSDIKLNFTSGDFNISQSGDIDVVGVIAGRKLSDVLNLVVQLCLMLALGEYSSISGIEGLSINDIIAQAPLTSANKEEIINIIKVVLIDKIMYSGVVSRIIRMDYDIDDINGEIYFNIEVETPTEDIVNFALTLVGE